MKNPDIEILETGGEGIYNGVHVNQELLCLCHNGEKSDAVRSMIQAMIYAESVMEREGMQFDSGSKGIAYSLITEALKKAGCE